MERLKIKAPLIGFMMEKSLLANGVTVSLAGWTKPVAEPEVAVHMAKDLAGGSDRAMTIAAIAGIGPAIELADLNPPPDDVEVTLAGNIFHRHVILGASDASRAGAKLDGLSGQVFRRGTLLPALSFEPLLDQDIHVVNCEPPVCIACRWFHGWAHFL